MRIDKFSNFYKTFANQNVNSDLNTAKNNQKNQNVSAPDEDRIELSSDVRNRDEIRFAVTETAKNVDKGASPEKLTSLKNQVQGGNYYVSSSDIADAMFVPFSKIV